MIKTLIVDDELENRNLLRHLLIPFKEELAIIAEADNLDTAENIIKTQKPELVFLDISLPPHNAFELLQRLPQIDFLIIFITAHHDYALKAFEYSAVSYLLKPLQEEQLYKAIQQAKGILSNKTIAKTYQTLLHNLQINGFQQETKICLPTLEGFDVIVAQDIMYCCAESNYTFVYLQHASPICVSKTLAEIEEILPSPQFFRIHKSHLINLSHLRKYLKNQGGVVIMSDGKELNISRRKKAQFIDHIRTHMGFMV
jgi:two-component system LytT family response regulator